MVFSSMLFLICFLPACLLAYYLIHAIFKNSSFGLKVENGVLLIFSLVFYAFGGVKYLALMIGIILINWVSGVFVAKRRVEGAGRKRNLIITVVLNLLVLFFFKYFNLVIAIIENVFFSPYPTSLRSWFLAEGNGQLGIKEVVLPIGISFYIFQALSYVIDVYRGNVKVQKNIFKFALYISFFPQLIAGPIVQYKDIDERLSDRNVSLELFSEGAKRFCIGLGKKVLLANTLGEVVDTIWALNTDHIGALIGWFAAIAYSFQIYYDFSGYSDMAIGLGKMFGFEFKENFNHPYLSESVQDFWRRWHISLSSWFRDYVYIPLGGSRVSKLKTYRNILIVFLLTGIWHGANQTFLFWGIGYGCLLVLERALTGKILKKNPLKFINRLITFTIVTLLWVIFRADDIFAARSFLGSLFRKGNGDYMLLSYLSANVLIAFIAAILASGILKKEKFVALLSRLFKDGEAVFETVTYFWCIILLVISMIFLVNGTYNPFIYFQF